MKTKVPSIYLTLAFAIWICDGWQPQAQLGDGPFEKFSVGNESYIMTSC